MQSAPRNSITAGISKSWRVLGPAPQVSKNWQNYWGQIDTKTEANLSQKTSENLFFMFCIVTKAKSLKFDEG